MSHADVVISNVTYEVSRVFSGSRSMKDLLKSQIMELNPKTLPTYRRKMRKQYGCENQMRRP